MSTASEVPQVGRNWWLFLILGLVSILAGVLAIVYPDTAEPGAAATA